MTKEDVQMKEQDKTQKKKKDKTPEELRKVKVNCLPTKEFKVMTIKMLKELRRGMDKDTEKLKLSNR